MKKVPHGQSGIGLIEVVIAVSILGVALSSIIITYRLYLKAAFKNTEVIKVAYLAEEGAEVLRIMRDMSWEENVENLESDTVYYLTYVSADKKWVASTTPEGNYVDGRYERTFVLGDVERDGNQDITSSGTIDPDIRSATIHISWFEGEATTTTSLSLYITNLFDN